MKHIELEKVFTPSTPAELTYIKRSQCEKQFIRALKTIGKQIIVYGHSGSGKSSLIVNILDELSYHSVTTRCTKGLSIESVLFDAFSQLGTYYIEQVESQKDEKINASLKVNLFNFFSGGFLTENKDSEKEIKKRIIDVQKNPHQLAKIFGESNCLWVIEDFHKLDNEPKRELSQIMKVFMDVSNIYPKTKIIAVGAVDTAREVVYYDSEMNNRVSEIHVPLMTPKEINAIISKGEILLNINIVDDVKERVVAYSSGLASVTHQLCYLLCESKNINKTVFKKTLIKEDDLEYAVNELVNEKSDSLKHIYEMALNDNPKRKTDSSKNILTAILNTNIESCYISDIIIELKKTFPNYNPKNIKKYISELTKQDKGEILRYNKNADTYSFSNPFIKGYCHIHLIKYTQKSTNKLHIEYRNSELLEKHLLDEFKQFMKEWEDEYIYED